MLVLAPILPRLGQNVVEVVQDLDSAYAALCRSYFNDSPEKLEKENRVDIYILTLEQAAQ